MALLQRIVNGTVELYEEVKEEVKELYQEAEAIVEKVIDEIKEEFTSEEKEEQPELELTKIPEPETPINTYKESLLSTLKNKLNL